jgi:hypothetical protein
LRLDLIKSSNFRSQLKEKILIDKYSSIIDLKPTEAIMQMNPILCKVRHRMGYFAIDTTLMSPMRMVLLPFLHERKLYLNRMIPGQKFFYFTIEIKKDALFHSIHNEGPKVKILMVCLNVSAKNYTIYSERGILINKVDYSPQAALYGEPIKVSSNGRNFIFKSSENDGLIHILTITQYELVFIKSINIRPQILKYAEQIDMREERNSSRSMVGYIQ